MIAPNFLDPEFLARLRARDSAAWEAIVDSYLPQLLRASRGMGFSVDEARDLAQSAFIGLVEGIGRFEGRSHIRTYLFGIFYNKVAERWRERRREQENDPIDDVMEARFDAGGRWLRPPARIEDKLFGEELRSMVRVCLKNVPTAQRIAFYLREVEAMTTEEICKKMSVTGTNLGVLLFRARNRLRECLEKKGLRRA